MQTVIAALYARRNVPLVLRNNPCRSRTPRNPALRHMPRSGCSRSQGAYRGSYLPALRTCQRSTHRARRAFALGGFCIRLHAPPEICIIKAFCRFRPTCPCQFSIRVCIYWLVLVPKNKFFGWREQIRQMIVSPNDLIFADSAQLCKVRNGRLCVVYCLHLPVFRNAARSFNPFLDPVWRIYHREIKRLIRQCPHILHTVYVMRNVHSVPSCSARSKRGRSLRPCVQRAVISPLPRPVAH